MSEKGMRDLEGMDGRGWVRAREGVARSQKSKTREPYLEWRKLGRGGEAQETGDDASEHVREILTPLMGPWVAICEREGEGG